MSVSGNELIRRTVPRRVWTTPLAPAARTGRVNRMSTQQQWKAFCRKVVRAGADLAITAVLRGAMSPGIGWCPRCAAVLADSPGTG